MEQSQSGGFTTRNKLGLCCSICTEDYNTIRIPKILTCGHTFCEPCLERIKTPLSLKCPNCKNETNSASKLTTNYALIEVIEKVGTQGCISHDKEILAYCADDSTSLCLECMIAHKNHDIFLVTDNRVSEITNIKFSQLTSLETELHELISTWKTAKSELISIRQGNRQFECHVQAFKKAEAKMIDNIKSGTKVCISKIEKLAKVQEIAELEKFIDDEIKRLESGFSNIQRERKRFSKLSIESQLNWKEIGFEKRGIPPKIDREELVGTNIRISDYEQAIISRALPNE
ncbi:unnamed protein product [Blepharisma stoltei]|uniref:RING-type domain-containing protein n=1 Tax=Blepharisma stoltei TaxID=1481888 RepID=A0AAU9IEG6_9CILI|nr:unnamed protein product [Blepharisma stoltei]